MTNKQMLEIALRQSAEDNGCSAEDFLSDKNVVVPFKLGEKARKYYKEPITCNFVTYGNNVVAATSDEVADIVKEYVAKFEFYHCFETPNLNWLSERLEKLGHKVCFMAAYFLRARNSMHLESVRMMERSLWDLQELLRTAMICGR